MPGASAAARRSVVSARRVRPGDVRAAGQRQRRPAMRLSFSALGFHLFHQSMAAWSTGAGAAPRRRADQQQQRDHATVSIIISQ
jgi:hypothetical protein